MCCMHRLTVHIYTPPIYCSMVLKQASAPHIQDVNVGETQWRNQCSSEPGENCSRFGPINSSAWFIIRFLCRAKVCLKAIWTNSLAFKTIIAFITYSYPASWSDQSVVSVCTCVCGGGCINVCPCAWVVFILHAAVVMLLMLTQVCF